MSIYYTDISVLFSGNTVLKVTAKTIWLTLVILFLIGWRECYGSSPTFCCRSFKVRTWRHVKSHLGHTWSCAVRTSCIKKILCGNLHNPKHSFFLQCFCLQTSCMKRYLILLLFQKYFFYLLWKGKQTNVLIKSVVCHDGAWICVRNMETHEVIFIVFFINHLRSAAVRGWFDHAAQKDPADSYQRVSIMKRLTRPFNLSSHPDTSGGKLPQPGHISEKQKQTIAQFCTTILPSNSFRLVHYRWGRWCRIFIQQCTVAFLLSFTDTWHQQFSLRSWIHQSHKELMW